MTKTIAPLLSLKARGSFGNFITYQKRVRSIMARQKPSPVDAKSLAQIYHRWLYQDYAYLWHALSAAEQRQWESDARRKRITGFNLWMQVKLNTLPDIAGGWHLDERAGATAIDFSKNLNHGTIYGASPATGVIDYALHFDALDDYVNCGTDPTLAGFTELTVECWVYKDIGAPAATYAGIAGDKDHTGGASTIVFHIRDGYFAISDGETIEDSYGGAFTPGVWTHLFFIWNPKQYLRLYHNLNLIKDLSSNLTKLNPIRGHPFYIGHYRGTTFPGIIDHITIYNRVLDATERQRHFERRYP